MMELNVVLQLESGIYSQKSFLRPPSNPVPIYPFEPIENPTAEYLAVPPKFAFCVQESVGGSYIQISCFAAGPTSTPIPIYPLQSIEKPVASSLATPPKLAFC